MIVDKKPQMKENDETHLRKEEPQPEVNEKTRLNRRILIIIGIALAAVIALLFAVTSVNFLAGPPAGCPVTRDQCFTNPSVTKYYIPGLPWCFSCSVNQ